MTVLFLSLLMLAGGDPQAGGGTLATPASSDPMDKIICRREVETGSLVRAKRQCHSRRQWAYIDEQQQSAARNLVDDGRSKGSVGN